MHKIFLKKIFYFLCALHRGDRVKEGGCGPFPQWPTHVEGPHNKMKKHKTSHVTKKYTKKEPHIRTKCIPDVVTGYILDGDAGINDTAAWYVNWLVYTYIFSIKILISTTTTSTPALSTINQTATPQYRYRVRNTEIQDAGYEEYLVKCRCTEGMGRINS